MQTLEEVNSLVLDVNRDVQAMVFFVRSPPRIDTDQKFLDLAKVATADFRALSAKVAELNDQFPEADTYIMSLDLVMEAIQSYLVSTIRKIRSCLTSWMDAQQSLSPGPTLEFLPPLIAEMSSLVESVVSNTKAIHRHLTGERVEPPKRPSSIVLSDRLEIHPVDELQVSVLVEDPSAENIASYLGVTVPPTSNGDAQPASEPEVPSKPIVSPSFEDLLRDYERQERKEERMKHKRANAPLKQVTKREAIEIDSEFLDAIVLHLSELTAVFFNESNHFGKKPIDFDSSTVAMPQIEANASLANEKALSLQTASIDMESFLNDNEQTHLAKLTGLHLSDIVSSMKDVIQQAPNVSWDALRLLDVAIKDYAETIKDVVQLSSPEVVEVPDEDEIVQSESDSDDEPPPPPKVQRLLTREEELLQDLDAVSLAFDALEMVPKPTRRRSSATSIVSVSPVLARSAPEAGILTASPPRTPSSWISGSSALAGSPIAARESRVTIQFPTYNTPVINEIKSSTPPPMASDEVRERERTRPVLTAAKSASFIEPTYELADEAVRSCEPLRMHDRWSEMQQRSELQRTISPDGVISTGSDRGDSKIKSAFKFMTSIRKKASSSRLSTSGGAASPSSSSRDSKRRTVGYSIGSGVASPNSSPLAPRKSMQLTGVLPTDPRLWLFEQPDDDSTLRISPETDSIVAGTIEKLVQRLTHDLMPDPDYVLQFLTTHKCFIPSNDLLELLCLRWDSAPPPDADADAFESSRLPSIRLRVYNVLKTWIERFWSDFAGEPELIERLQIFSAAMYHSGLSSASQTLTKLIHRNRFEEVPKPQLGEPPLVYDFVRRSRHEPPIVPPNNTSNMSSSSDAIGANGSHLSPPTTPTSRSASPLPMNGSLAAAQAMSKSYVPAILTCAVESLPRPLTILDFHPFEIARQVSSMEWELWKQVKNVELLDVAWTRKDKETRAPNVLNMIRFSNHITNWLISEILAPEDPKERSVVLNRCIWVVKALIELRNFNGAMEALSAFHSSAIFRLKSTWNLLPPPTWSIYESLEKLMSPDANFKTYRAEYDRSVPPCTPYLGTHLSDLLFLEESLPRHIEGNKLINFAKMEKTAQFIQTLELSQQIPYHFVEIPIIRSYIKNYSPLDPKDAYNRSLAVEARKQKPGRGPPGASYRNTTIGTSESPPISSSPSL